MKLVICGGSGYIGTLLSKKLYELGHEIKIIDLCWFGNNLPRYIQCEKKDLFDCTEEDFNDYDQVIFLAGLSNDPMSDFDPKLNYLYNSSLPSYLANISKKANVRRFIYASSCSIYGSTNKKNIQENGDILTNFPYGISKYQGEIGIKNIQDDTFSTISLRMGTVGGYSPKMRFDVVLNAMYKSALSKNKIIINNPEIYRPILDIRDAINSYILAIECDYNINGEFNICSENVKIGELGERIYKYMKPKYKNLELIKLNVKDNRNYIVNIDKAKKILGYKPNYKIEDTLKNIEDNFTDIYIEDNKYLNIKVFERLFINKNYFTLKKCRICDNNVKLLLDLNDQPLANNFHNNDKEQEKFPLKLMLCEYCYHSQLSIVVNPKILFSNYLYVSGTSNTLIKYFEWFVKMIGDKCIKKGKILDIACNDGSLLNVFKKNNWDTYGVDPASNLVKNITKHKVINDFWSRELSLKLNNKFDIIVAQNVLAHLDDVHDFIEGCKNVMTKNSYLFIQTSQKNMFINNEFDTIYHEHVSFFSIKSMKILLEKHNLYINDIIYPEIHGTSYLFIITLNDNKNNFLSEELKIGRYDLQLYEKYTKHCYQLKEKVLTFIDKYKHLNKKIIGFGAAAKGNTFLNFCKIKLDYIIDENEKKNNLYTPGTNIIVKNLNFFMEEKESVICIILAWNFTNEIVEKIKKRKTKDIILIFYPEIKCLSG